MADEKTAPEASWGKWLAATIIISVLIVITGSWYKVKSVEWAEENKVKRAQLARERIQNEKDNLWNQLFWNTAGRGWVEPTNLPKICRPNHLNLLGLNYLAHLSEKAIITDNAINTLGKQILLNQAKLVVLNKLCEEARAINSAEEISIDDFRDRIEKCKAIVNQLNSDAGNADKLFNDYFYREEVVSPRWAAWREEFRKEGKWNEAVTCDFKAGFSEYKDFFSRFNYYLILVDNDILDKKYRDLSEAELQRIGKSFVELMMLHESGHQELSKLNGTYATTQQNECFKKFYAKVKEMGDLLDTSNKIHGQPRGRWFDKLDIWEYLSWSKKWEEWAGELEKELGGDQSTLDIIRQKINEMKAENQLRFSVDFR